MNWMKKWTINEMGGNIPVGTFLGGSFPGGIFQGGVWGMGIFRVGLFAGGIFLEPLWHVKRIFLEFMLEKRK